MKYIITGSIGHISKPLSQQLIAAGHHVTIITSNSSKVDEIRSIGAAAAVGSVEDSSFLIKTLAGADGVYLMVPPKWTVTDWFAFQKEVVDHYIAAVKANQIKYIVALSSIGAHMRKGAGPVDGLGYLEEELAKLTDTNVRILRPGYFFYNLFSQIPMIKQAGFVGSTQPADFKLALTDTSDIAITAAADFLSGDFTGHEIKNIGSDDTHTWTEIAQILGAAIGKTDLPYVELTDEQSRAGMLQAGLNPVIAEGYVAMGKALRDGEMQADYWQNPPKTLGKIKLADFAQVFAGAYLAS